LLEWAKVNNVDGDLATLCKSPIVNSLIMKELDVTGKGTRFRRRLSSLPMSDIIVEALKLRGFEFVKKIYLHPEVSIFFSPPNIIDG